MKAPWMDVPANVGEKRAFERRIEVYVGPDDPRSISLSQVSDLVYADPAIFADLLTLMLYDLQRGEERFDRGPQAAWAMRLRRELSNRSLETLDVLSFAATLRRRGYMS